MNLISSFNFAEPAGFLVIRCLLRVSAVRSCPRRNAFEREILCVVRLARTASLPGAFNEARALCFASKPLADSDFYPSLPRLQAALNAFYARQVL